MPTTFRIDEFARTPDGALSARDRTRFTGVGFDLQSSVLVAVNLIRITGETFRAPTIDGGTFTMPTLASEVFAVPTIASETFTVSG